METESVKKNIQRKKLQFSRSEDKRRNQKAYWKTKCKWGDQENTIQYSREEKKLRKGEITQRAEAVNGYRSIRGKNLKK